MMRSPRGLYGLGKAAHRSLGASFASGGFCERGERRAKVLLATAVVAGLAFATASMVTPSYRSETRLLIEPRALAFATRDATGVDSQVLDELNIASQVQVLQSVDLIKQVARDMKLYELNEFDPDWQP